MLNALVDWSLRNRIVVVVLAALLLVAGIYAAGHAHLDVFPEFAPPQVEIQTEAPSLSPSDVEALVTKPIEDAVNGLPRLNILRSQSVQGLSVVTAIFTDSADIYRARQQISERLSEVASQLPAGVKPPRMTPLVASTGRLLSVGFTSDKMSLLDLRDRVQWNIRPRILALRGVAQVTVFGGEVRQYQVRFHPEALAARQLSVTDVLDAVRQATGIRGAGFLENDRQRVILRSEGQVHSVAELAASVVVTPPAPGRSEPGLPVLPVLLGDIAEVVEGPEPKFGDALVNGKPGVVLIIYRQLEGDTPEITARVEAEVDRLKTSLERQGIAVHPRLFRQANFIEHALGNLTFSLILGGGLVAAVLLLFLFNLRTAFITLTAIPLSLLTAILVLTGLGLSLNTMTLGGLAIAIGEVVDDAIIDVENIVRRLRENARLPQPDSAFRVVLRASLEVRSAVVYATFIVVLVFVPVFFLSGLQGRLFAPLAYAYILAILASLAVAVTVTPALSLLLLPQSGTRSEPPLMRPLQAAYERLLRAIDAYWPTLLGAMLLLLIVSIVALTRFGASFIGEMRENHFIVHMHGIPGTSLKETLATGKDLYHALREEKNIPPVVKNGIASVVQQAGRAELGEDTWGVEYAEIEVALNRLNAAEREEVEKYIKHEAEETPGFTFDVFSFLSERIKELLAGATADVVVRIQGDELRDIERTADQVFRIVATVPGNDKLRIEPQTGTPEIAIRINSSAASQYLLPRTQILDAIQTAFQGTDVGQVFQGNRVIDIRVLLHPKHAGDLEAVRNLWISLPASEKTPDGPGRRIRLKQVAEVYLSDGRFLISHEGGLRQQLVMCKVEGRDVGSFAAELERQLQKLDLPPGVTLTLAGEHVARAAAANELFWSSLLAGFCIIVLLAIAYGSLGRVLLILANLPFALVGGVAAVALTGAVLDVGSLIGFITLFGITTRNSMMLVSHWQHLHDVEGMAWGAELVFRGARERLAPVLMTALVTGLGLLPIALGRNEAGREIEGPMACVILGGLVTSTILNLVLLPLLFKRWGLPSAYFGGAPTSRQ